jgi:hypothetical protein
MSPFAVAGWWEAQRCVSVARSFERLARGQDGVTTALNEHWAGEAEAWWLAHHPPWPEGVTDVESARAELVRIKADFDEQWTSDTPDMRLMTQALERNSRVRFCLDLVEKATRDQADEDDRPAGTAEPVPPVPPVPPWPSTPPVEAAQPGRKDAEDDDDPTIPLTPAKAGGQAQQPGTFIPVVDRDARAGTWVPAFAGMSGDTETAPPIPSVPSGIEQADIERLDAPDFAERFRPSLLDPADWDRPVPEQIALLERRARRRQGFGERYDDVAAQIARLQAHATAGNSTGPGGAVRNPP